MVEAWGGAIQQISPSGQVLREVRHPLEPEMLVAEMAGELPVEVALAVRQHVQECESCGVRAKALAHPYGALASLGAVPVPAVPDLRRHVRQQWAKGHVLVRVARAARIVGGGGIAGILALLALALVASLFIVTNAFQAPAIIGRSSSAGPSAAAGDAGVVYVETNKALDLRVGNGPNWTVAEVIAVDERTGQVRQSLPASGGAPRVARAAELPEALALAPNERLIYELTSPQVGGQALIALDAKTGQVAFITPLRLPDGRALPEEMIGRGLGIGPGSQRVYVSLAAADSTEAPSILELNRAGAHVARWLTPALPSSVAEPVAGSGLPGVTTQQPITYFATDGLRTSLAAGGTLVVAPDGLSVFDVVTLGDATGLRGVVVRRIDTSTGATMQALALPGDFSIAALAASTTEATPLVYLARVGHDGELYLFNTQATTLTLQNTVPLGEPRAPANAAFSGALALSPTADGARVYVSADIAVPGTQISSHDIWLIDGPSASIVSHRIEFALAGQALANWAGGARAQLLVLRDTQVVLLPLDLTFPATPPTWLHLSDGLPLLRLIATADS